MIQSRKTNQTNSIELAGIKKEEKNKKKATLQESEGKKITPGSGICTWEELVWEQPLAVPEWVQPAWVGQPEPALVS